MSVVCILVIYGSTKARTPGTVRIAMPYYKGLFIERNQ